MSESEETPPADGSSEEISSEEMAARETRPEESPRARTSLVRQTILIGAAFILGFVVLGLITIQGWEYSNSVDFCANACHDVHPEESHAFQDSYHANVLCTECHMGRVGTLRNIVLKASHFRHLPEVLFDNYGRPLESESMRPANESCELCHWPPAFHGDTSRKITRFLPDEENTEERTYLLMKTGAGTREEGEGYGIHWHITNPVEYIASDEHKQEIPWVRTTLPDGRTIEYHDVSNPLTEEKIASSEKRVMDCVDCHNRVGHPFPPPEDLIDAALADGDLSQNLPHAKKEMNELLSASHASRDDAMAAVGQVRQQYEDAHADVAGDLIDEIEAAEQLAQTLLNRLVFDEPGVTWQDFPDNGKHKDFPGCFRCHDGKHISSEGQSIRLHCNICHSIPVTVGQGDRPPDVPVASIQEPSSHLESSFMADHRFQANGNCAECHGEIQFGSDDSSFCANSSCHGKAWPLVELDAGFQHPIALEGKHAEVWCHDCHEGVREPEYLCAHCHEPPTDPHFGEACEDCHSPRGFKDVHLAGFQHPIELEGAHAQASCSDCHAADRRLTFDCSECHQPPSDTHFGDDCEACHAPTTFMDAAMPPEMHPIPLEGAHRTASCDGCHVETEPTPQFACAGCHQPPSDPHFGDSCEECHTPTGFADATLPPELHPIPLEGAHQAASCDGCHVEGEAAPEYVCSNCHPAPDSHLVGECNACHTPEGFSESASFLVSLAPMISHELEGREDCLVCHDPEGQIKPAPSNHGDYSPEQCGLCHKPVP